VGNWWCTSHRVRAKVADWRCRRETRLGDRPAATRSRRVPGGSQCLERHNAPWRRGCTAGLYPLGGRPAAPTARRAVLL